MAYLTFGNGRYSVAPINEYVFKTGGECWITDLETGSRIYGQLNQDGTKFIVNSRQRVSKNKPVQRVELFEDLQTNGVYRMSYKDTKTLKERGVVECKLMDYNNNLKEGRILKVFLKDGVITFEDSDTPFENKEIEL